MHGDGVRDRSGFRFIEADEQGNGTNSDPISLHRYLYADAQPITLFDPSGHDSLGELLTAMGLDELVESENDSGDVAEAKTARSEISDFEDYELSGQGEILWTERLESVGFTVLPLQQYSTGTHGPDLLAWGTPSSTGVFTFLLGEVKATTYSGVTSLLGQLEDGAVQMSLQWVRKYERNVITSLLQYITSQVSLLPAAYGKLAGTITNAIQTGSIDYYLLRARLYPMDQYWVTQGFQLLQVGNKGVKVASDGSIEELEEPEDFSI